MAFQTSITIPNAQADRARHLAAHHETSLGDFLARLIDRTYEADLGIFPTDIEQHGQQLQLAIGNEAVMIPASQASQVANAIRDSLSATRPGTTIDLDCPCGLVIERAHKGIFVSALDGSVRRWKLSTAEALRLADDLARHSLA